MKTYLLAMYQPAGPAPTDEELEPVMRDLGAITTDLADTGALVFNGGLFPPSTATTVRHNAGIGPVNGTFNHGRPADMLLTDGPFIEAKEHLGGFYLVEADDLDAALEIAARIPAARMGGAVEVRPLVER
jgi:hypothetical protein